MHRRLGTVVMASALLVGALVMPAAAAGEARLLTPADGDVVKDRVSLLVEVDQGADELSLRLSKDGVSQASKTASIPLPCVENCDSDATSRWGNRTFDPVGGAPFSSGGVCNGLWTVQARLDQGSWFNLGEVTFSALPAAPTGVRATAGENVVEIVWTPSKAPDVVGYRVERRSGSGWVTIVDAAAADTWAEDRTVSRGVHTYRVVALRPDGFTNGQPAPPCSDKDADLEAVSAEASADFNGTTAPTDPDEGGEGSGTSGSGTSGSGTNGSGTSGSGTNGSGPSSGPTEEPDGSQPGTSDEPSTDPNGNPNGTTSSSSGGRARQVAPPPAARRQTDNSVAAPQLDSGGEEYYYGEGEEFGEIDYGTIDPVTGQPAEIIGYDEDGQPIYRVIAGGLQESSITTLDASKMRAIAMGLLLVALALHSRRWIHALN